MGEGDSNAASRPGEWSKVHSVVGEVGLCIVEWSIRRLGHFLKNAHPCDVLAP